MTDVTKVILMDPYLKTLNKEQIETVLKIGQVKIDENEVPYVVIDMDVYLENYEKLKLNERIH